ncbi:DNA polymerase beta superfamily protein [Dawidia soli]|uniref:Nucleotidyltransferase domain-containing protein n=1 Tax=Dawidia soli TaxID=2782352 RepID=A0AAP2DIC9_9BACT|nr:nucleotidyltransferase domain-containing protein [Dawidia soli]MBT1689922.1 nucleotidyltransferase domain-containing protein [Dawidia soli]
MTLQELEHSKTHLLLKCISGSQAYGLALPHSDTDIKGIFILPRRAYYGMTYTDQVNNETNDIAYYEIGKIVDLLVKNNPNILELLSTPDDCVLYRHPAMARLRPEMFLSRLCNQTFGQYAYAQIKKARGLNKKILNPVGEVRKTILDFCYVLEGQGSLPLTTWLAQRQYRQEDCGLVRVEHMREVYVVFHQSQTDRKLHGITSGATADEVSLSSIPAGLEPQAMVYFNKDGYSVYCKEYRQYWEWVQTRNEARYENTLNHGRRYDAKNIMHVFRILAMAEEIAREGRVHVRRADRAWLLRIRAGEFLYEDLLKQAEERMQRIGELFQTADLPDVPDIRHAEEVLVNIREEFYRLSID